MTDELFFVQVTSTVIINPRYVIALFRGRYTDNNIVYIQIYEFSSGPAGASDSHYIKVEYNDLLPSFHAWLESQHLSL